MKRSKIYEWYDGIINYNGSGKSLAYAASKNEEVLLEAIKLISKEEPHIEKFKEFQDKIEKLRIDFAKKGPDGKPIIKQRVMQDGSKKRVYDIPDMDKKDSPFIIAAQTLEEKYSEFIEAQNKAVEEYLEGEFTPNIRIRKISYDDLPMNITKNEMKGILFMVDETTVPGYEPEKDIKENSHGK